MARQLTERFQVGVITGTHGLRGEVKVFPTTDDPARFLDLKEVILQTGRGERRVGIRSVKFFKKFVILGFSGMDRIEDVEKLRGSELLVERADAAPLEEGEYYIADLIGISVRAQDGTVIGTLREVIETGANDVYAVAREGKKDLLLPAIPECILDVRVEEGVMTVYVMPGLEEL
ncbi:MAG: ribosome maturation factor RimM [Eubacteriales bacterium]|nr:ribosome maturation factor RimM [Eubacteriales bacterium]